MSVLLIPPLAGARVMVPGRFHLVIAQACASGPVSLGLAGDAVFVSVQLWLAGGIVLRNVVPTVILSLGAIGVRGPGLGCRCDVG